MSRGATDDASIEVLVIDIELHLPMVSNLKAKRSVVQSIVRTIDGWKGVGAAEVGFLDKWQRTRIGVSIVGGSVSHLDDVAAAVERHVWSVPGVDVLSIDQRWVEQES